MTMTELYIAALLVLVGVVALSLIGPLRRGEAFLSTKAGKVGFTISCVVILGLVAALALTSDADTGGIFGYVPDQPTKGDEAVSDTLFAAVKIGLLFVAMCLGMTSKFFWDAMENKKPNGKLRLQWTALIKPFLVAPFIYGVVWKAAGASLDVAAVCLSYQNGFMWQTVLGKVKE